MSYNENSYNEVFIHGFFTAIFKFFTPLNNIVVVKSLVFN